MGAHRAAAGPADRVGFAAVLRIRLFAVLFAAETQSIVGDQLARVALSVLVFEQTGSAPATAATYAATLLPAIAGGLFLSRIGDRWPRRSVMIACDLVRALCFAMMALPGISLGPVIVIVVFAVAFGPVFSSAQVSLLAGRLEPAEFRAANGLRMIATQGAQVGGFVFGGLVVALLGPRVTLLVDAVTFVISAVLVASVRRRHRVPNASGSGAAREPEPATVAVEAADEFRGVWRDPRLRGLVMLAMLAGFFVVPEGLAVPYGDSVGASTPQIGLLLGAGAAGGAIGAAVLVRIQVAWRRELVAGWLAVLCGLPLLVTATEPSWPVAAVCWLLSGLLAAYMVEVITLIVQSIPDSRRAHLVGVLSALLLASQGAGLIGFGALSQVVAPGLAIAAAGAAGLCVALLVVIGQLGGLRRRPVPVVRDANATHAKMDPVRSN